jgi:hypothetical protein
MGGYGKSRNVVAVIFNESQPEDKVSIARTS